MLTRKEKIRTGIPWGENFCVGEGGKSLVSSYHRGEKRRTRSKERKRRGAPGLVNNVRVFFV